MLVVLLSALLGGPEPFARAQPPSAFRGRAPAPGERSPEAASEAPAAEPLNDDELDPAAEYQGGLVVECRADGAPPRRWVAHALAFGPAESVPTVGHRSSDAPGSAPARAAPFSLTARGFLHTITPGEYRLHVAVAGSVEIELADQTIVRAVGRADGWVQSDAVALGYGYHPLVVRWQAERESDWLGVYWSGPRFAPEAIAPRHLVHSRAEAEASAAETAARWVRALRCTACHQAAAGQLPLEAPSLVALAGNLRREWIIDRLTEAEPSADVQPRSEIEPQPATLAMPPAGRQMPHFAMPRADARAIAAALLADVPAPSDLPAPSGDHESGRLLLASVGCLACHQLGRLGDRSPFGGGDLSMIADKRPPGFFARWLAEPAALNPRHRMPVFALDDHERNSLAAYLATLSSAGVRPPHEQGPPGDDVPPANARHDARALAAKYRCGACHELPHSLEGVQPARPIALRATAGTVADCLGRPDPAAGRPGYQFPAAPRAAMRAELLCQPTPPVAALARGSRLIDQYNCLGCHARGHRGGLAAQIAAIAAEHQELAPRAAALRPPALDSIGDKLHEPALIEAVAGRALRMRPWLDVRMPRFHFAPGQAEALAAHLVAADRLPEGVFTAPEVNHAESQQSPSSDSAADRLPERSDAPERDAPAQASNEPTLLSAGARLVTSDGFGCTSCHQIGSVEPLEVALAARGTNLSLLGGRIRREWFDRWVREPARMVPQMEMPSVQLPIRGVLAESLDRQLAAVWKVLNQPGFEPPQPNPIRVVRRSNVPEAAERAEVLCDVIVVDADTFIAPLVIGLANRHNLLFDLGDARPAAWWIGDVARQRTRHKSWYWEAGGADLGQFGSGAELLIRQGERWIEPQRLGQFVTRCDAWEHCRDGVRFEHRLHYPVEGAKTPLVLRVVQTIRALADAPGRRSRGFARELSVAGLPEGMACAWFPVGRARPAGWQIDRRDPRRLIAPQDLAEVVLRSHAPPRFEALPQGAAVRLEGRGAQAACGAACDYRARVAADQYLTPANEVPPRVALTLPTVPGFEAVQLPLDERVMPTAMAWRPDGRLVLSSLKGQVFLVDDADADGLLDRYTVVSDELACPYGLAVVDDRTIDVVTKLGLLRLIDCDGDQRADRTELLAAGWGHTDDYHDWAVGLPRDPQGNYYVALPCQQDQRSAEAAALRGQIVKLVPRQPSLDDPARFAIESLAAGLRFPMGLALDRDGELFATDNQGNYTPFNELNHIRPARRYGFINRLENTPGFDPPFEPPAIAIPHPWTRSVNGICFLISPDSAADGAGFGPYEGHLIGCEYDTRRLVRMTLQRVAGAYQGAVYPFSSEPPGGQPTFEGPLVCRVSPAGELYVGSIRDSGWGAGANTGSLVRLRFTGRLKPGIVEVRAVPLGFQIDCAAPLDPERLAAPGAVSISSFRRLRTPDYGGPDRDRRSEEIAAWRLSESGRRLHVELAELREGFVYEIRLGDVDPRGAALFPAEAYYTLEHAVEP